ncbi:MAG: 1-aminocyclopropane-1-carboxylate deaminase/D-cysteine desulfhydrase [Candidatus Binatia bacterium]
MSAAAADRTPTAALSLVRRFPALAGLPRHALTALPTPVQALARVGQRVGHGGLWIKRDDLSCPLYGGNKPRKLEWLLGAARARGRTGVITFGGIGTHHGLATTICAGDAGLRSVLVLLPQPLTEDVRHSLLLDHAYGAEMHLAGSVGGIVARSLRLVGAALVRGAPLAIIPTGGTSALGAIGYVEAACELAEQVRAGLLPEPGAIVVPLGSGGTLAGLALGCRLAGLRSRVVGILVTDILPPSGARLARLAGASLRLLRRAAPEVPTVRLGADMVAIESGYLGRAYGAPTDAGLAARQLLADEEGIRLDTTYTAKSMAAMLDLSATPAFRHQPLLFWNTYSSIDPGAALPALPDWRQLPTPFHQFFA